MFGWLVGWSHLLLHILLHLLLIFRTLRGPPPLQLRAGRPGGETQGGPLTDLKFGQNLDRIRTEAGRHTRTKRRRESLKIVSKFLPGGSPGLPKSIQAPSPSTLERRKTTCDPKRYPKSRESRPKVVPSGTQKSTKID